MPVVAIANAKGGSGKEIRHGGGRGVVSARGKPGRNYSTVCIAFRRLI